jgi:hypothetical protein
MLAAEGGAMTGRIDHVGQRFGLWIVLALHPERYTFRYGKKSGAFAQWLCRCEGCGTERVVLGGTLRQGRSRSCGDCGRVKHGHCRNHRSTRIYEVWHSMMQRCYNPNHPAYAHYGGRGISVCERWHSFVNFFIDMGVAPPGKSLDRRNNDGDYTPENCRWATRAEQMRNRRPPQKKLRIKLNDAKILAGIKELTARLAQAGART